MPALRLMLFTFALFSSALPMVLKAEDPREFIVRFGYESATKVQQEANLRIDEESGRLSKVLLLAEKRSKIDGRLNSKGQKIQLQDGNGIPDANFRTEALGGELGIFWSHVPDFETAHLVFARSTDRKVFIEKAKAKLDELESQRDSLPKWCLPEFDIAGSRMNQAGWLHFDDLRVVQNLGDGSFLGKFEGNKYYEELPVMLIVGMPGAKDFSDDHRISDVSPKNLVICNRTYKYSTAGNSTRTVHVLEFCNQKSVEAYIDAHVPLSDRAPKEKPIPIPKPKLKPKPIPKPNVERVWSDMSGKFAVSATLKSIADGKVTLLKADGTETVVPIDRLSKKDQEWLESQKE
ncbi:MAG: SHD1 domain-containing protein [Planctomycetota bacterium]|nr:SHD1 domain-containing protein [Planctomycetota bacterium]